MSKKIDKTPFILAAIFILAAFFLSCTKKSQPQASVQTHVIPTYITQHGYKVQFEPATTTNPASPQPQVPPGAATVVRIPASSPK